jgi:diguanylate cyclase
VSATQTPPTKAPAAQRVAPMGRISRFVWWSLGVLLLLEAVHELTGIFPHRLFADWVHDGLLIAAVVLCSRRIDHRTTEGRAWAFITAGLASWTIGEVLWTLFWDNQPNPPYPGPADAFWLACYPLLAVGGALLVSEHLPRFEWHRWMDGLAVVLIVITAGIAVLIEPVVQHSHQSPLAAIVDFSYPILDVLILGSVLGIYGLLGWRPGRTWLLLGIGCSVLALADAIFAVQEARSALSGEQYDFLWPAAALLVAGAAWSSAPPGSAEAEVYGWRAIALPLAAQALAGGIQIYGFLYELGRSERIVTLAVLVIASMQIIITRPRAPDQPGAGPP